MKKDLKCENHIRVILAANNGKRLVIELDGGQHAESADYDSARTLKLEADDFQVLRFWNNEVFGNIDGVLEIIDETLNTPHPPQKARRPLPQGER